MYFRPNVNWPGVVQLKFFTESFQYSTKILTFWILIQSLVRHSFNANFQIHEAGVGSWHLYQSLFSKTGELWKEGKPSPKIFNNSEFDETSKPNLSRKSTQHIGGLLIGWDRASLGHSPPIIIIIIINHHHHYHHKSSSSSPPIIITIIINYHYHPHQSSSIINHHCCHQQQRQKTAHSIQEVDTLPPCQCQCHWNASLPSEPYICILIYNI